MLKDKELKFKQQEITQIEADWSKAHKDILESKLSVTDADADNRDRSHSIETAQTFQENCFKPKQEFRRFFGGSKSFLTRMEIIEEIRKARARNISPFC